MTPGPPVSRPIEHLSLYTSTGEALSARLDELERLLNLHSVRIPNGSRFHRYRRLMSQPGADTSLLHQAFLECEQLRLIVSTLGQSRAPAGFKEKLRTVLSGPHLPSPGHDASPARDHQFELFVAAISQCAGYQPTLEEPDLRLTGSNQQTFVVAAKRLKSPSKLRSNVRKASKQIATAESQGMIALDITRLLQEPNQPIDAVDLRSAAFRVSQLVNAFREGYIRRVRSYCDLDWTFGALLVFTGLALVRQPKMLAMVWQARTVNLCDQQDPRCKLLASYTQAMTERPPIGSHMRRS